MGYCEQADLYSYGLPRGALRNPGRLVGSVSAVTDSIELDDHGLVTNGVVTFRAEAGGSLPSPLVAGVEYFAVPTTDSAFQVAAFEDGPAIDLTTAGSRVLAIVKLSKADAIAWGAALIDDMLPGHAVPLTAPYPPIVVMTNAELAASRLLALTGGLTKTLGEIVDAARKRLERWGRGVPIRGTNAPDAGNLALVSAAVPVSDTRGWTRYGGL